MGPHAQIAAIAKKAGTAVRLILDAPNRLTLWSTGDYVSSTPMATNMRKRGAWVEGVVATPPHMEACCVRLPKRQERLRFWELVRAGGVRTDAAVAAGVPEQPGRRWFHQAGGVLPPHVPETSSGRYLSFSEREEIFAGVERGESIRQIAKLLGRAPSTVLRELRPNMRRQLYRSRSRLRANPDGKRRTLPWNYRPSWAQERIKRLASRPKTAKLAKNPPLRELVQAKLMEKRSPEQISRELRQQFPDDAEMQLSPETIYHPIYAQGRGALRRERAVCLRTGRALRRPRRKSQERRGRIPNMINISERPA